MWTVSCREPMTQSTAWPRVCSPATSIRLCTLARGWRLERYSSTPTTRRMWPHLLEASSSPALAKTLVSKDTWKTMTVDVNTGSVPQSVLTVTTLVCSLVHRRGRSHGIPQDQSCDCGVLRHRKELIYLLQSDIQLLSTLLLDVWLFI